MYMQYKGRCAVIVQYAMTVFILPFAGLFFFSIYAKSYVVVSPPSQDVLPCVLIATSQVFHTLGSSLDTVLRVS